MHRSSPPTVRARSSGALSIAIAQAVSPAAISAASLLLISFLVHRELTDRFAELAVLVALLAMAIMHVRLLDDSTRLVILRRELAAAVLLRWMLLLGVLLAIGYLAKVSGGFSRRVLLVWATVTPFLIIAGMFYLRGLLKRYLAAPFNARKVVFAGYNDVSLKLAERLKQNAELSMAVAGFSDDRSAQRLGLAQSIELVGTLAELPHYVREKGIDVIFVALPVRHVQRVLTLLDELQDTTASIYYVPDILVFDLIQARTGTIMDVPVVAMCESPFQGHRGTTKRLLDVCIASLLLLLLTPLLLAIAALIKLTSPGPVLFKQRRYGLDGEEIVVYKFRTMRVREDGDQIPQAQRGDQRVTPLGSVLRRFSIDELPQLFNVLQGSMSLVGPRPHAVAHNEQYRRLIKGYMIRHKVRPGITGLAQISGCRGETAQIEDMEERVRYDLEYLRRWSPTLDLKILCLTVSRVLRDDQAY